MYLAAILEALQGIHSGLEMILDETIAARTDLAVLRAALPQSPRAPSDVDRIESNPPSLPVTETDGSDLSDPRRLRSRRR